MSDDHAIEGGAGGADPFAALHDGKRSFLLEVEIQTFGSKDKHLSKELGCPAREPRPNGAVAKRLVPDLILDVVQQVFRTLGLVACCHTECSRQNVRTR